MIIRKMQRYINQDFTSYHQPLDYMEESLNNFQMHSLFQRDRSNLGSNKKRFTLLHIRKSLETEIIPLQPYTLNKLKKRQLLI